MSKSSCFWLTRLGALTLGLLAAVTVVAGPVKFDIPAQPADAALELFIRQSGTEVMYNQSELAKAQSTEVRGEIEPDVALTQLLTGTGYTHRKSGDNKYMITPLVAPTGAIEGAVQSGSGRPISGARVSLVGSSQTVRTDKRGRFTFDEVPAGPHVLAINAEAMQNTKVTDVNVRAGHRLTLSTIEVPLAATGAVQLEDYVVSAKKNDGVIELDPYEVSGTKQKPFADANVDIPRTINDTQAYYIYDSKTIDQSGAVNIEGFLKQRLTMNAAALTNGQTGSIGSTPNTLGNSSAINLRGLGSDKTLILVNGRRVAGVTIQQVENQPDLNGIALDAIDRIEVLPSSASGIYGGSAIGGVVNIIIKRDYSGGELRATYNNAWDTDSPNRSISFNYGFALEHGKTYVTLRGAWSDARPQLLQDRRDGFERNIEKILANSPSLFYSATSPWLGSLPNITSASSSTATLVLKNGTSLNAPITHVSGGISSSTSVAQLNASLLANAGSFDFTLPPTTQSSTGLLNPLEVTPVASSLYAGIRRFMLSRLEIFADYSFSKNNTESIFNPFNLVLTVPASSPINPFTTTVRVKVPDARYVPIKTKSSTQSATLGLLAKLPHEWTVQADYTWSVNRYSYHYYDYDTIRVDAALADGTLNPFVDTLSFPLALDPYLRANIYDGESILHDFSARGAGTIISLPWGALDATIGLEHRISVLPERFNRRESPSDPANVFESTLFERETITDSGYLEVAVPFVDDGWLPGLRSLGGQFAGRMERYEVDTGTPSYVVFPNRTPPLVSYGTPNRDGRPFFQKTDYESKNYTIGLKYKPTHDIIVRASQATAFVPPTPAQLAPSNTPSTLTSSVVDPMTGRTMATRTVGGGNPNLVPQHSKSSNFGIIWEPRWKKISTLRINAEYFKIKQFDYITTLSAQQIVTLQDTFPDRVTRDAAGNITLVDVTFMNLFRRETEGWDFTVDYAIKTDVGVFSLQASESIILHLKNQYSSTHPEYDAVNYPSEGGAAKYKGTASLTWNWRGWSSGWTAQYFSSYRQNGAVGGPSATQRAATGTTPAGRLPITTLTAAQGADSVPSQVYHDVFVSYAFGRRPKIERNENQNPWALPRFRSSVDALLDGFALHLGIRNIFGTEPPLDVNYSANRYFSPYGSSSLRTYQLSVRKKF